MLNTKVNVIRTVGADGGCWPFGRGFEGRGARWHRHRAASWIHLGITLRAWDCSHWKQAHTYWRSLKHQLKYYGWLRRTDCVWFTSVILDHSQQILIMDDFVFVWKPKLTIFQVTKGSGTIIWKQGQTTAKMNLQQSVICYRKNNEHSPNLNNSQGI